MELLSDFAVLIGWVGTILKQLINTFLAPLNFVFTFLRSFLASAFSSPAASGITYSWNSQILAVFDYIPYFSVIKLALFAGLSILIVFYIFRQLTKV